MTKKHLSPYGLVALETISQDPYVETTIPGCRYEDVVTTDLPYAKNHCAATAIANLALYFANIGKSSAVSETPEKTLRSVYEMVGDGPILFFKKRAERYFRKHGEILSMHAISRAEISSATGRGHISVLLLKDGLFHWHWVLGVGERVYGSGRKYLMVMDGWHRSSPRYLEITRRENFVYALECEMKMF